MTASAFFAPAAPPLVAALMAATAFALPVSALAANGPAMPTRSAEWWLSTLNVPKAWQSAPGEGAGITVAVLSTGVDAAHPDLTGDVTTGPDLSGSGRGQGGTFWGFEGTAVASLIAGHGHGPGGTDGITGIAPRARILSLRVTLEYDDPLNGDAAITRKLPDAIATGIRYAVSHGARVIALPLDPGTFGPAATGDPAAAGGSEAEREAVSYALAHNVVLVAPAGDNGASTDTANYPAAYPGVIAVGATGKNGGLAPFTNVLSYVAVTAPGVGIIAAAPDGGYETLSSSDMSSALVAGVAALIRSRFPRLTAAETARALESGTTAIPNPPRPGGGHGQVDAADAISAAATINASLPPPSRSHPPRLSASSRGSEPSAGQPVEPDAGRAAPRRGAGMLVGSVLRGVVIVAGVLIAVLAVTLTLVRRGRRLAVEARRAATAPSPAGPAAVTRTALPRQGGSHSRRAIGAAKTAHREEPGARIQVDDVLHGTAFNPNGAGRAASRARSVAYPARPRVIPMTISGAGRRVRRDVGRPPWELFPESSPVSPPVVSPDRPLTNSGPMYVWNPAASSGPFPAAPDPASQSHPEGERSSEARRRPPL